MGHPFQHPSSEIYGQTPYDNFMIYKYHERYLLFHSLLHAKCVQSLICSFTIVPIKNSFTKMVSLLWDIHSNMGIFCGSAQHLMDTIIFEYPLYIKRSKCHSMLYIYNKSNVPINNSIIPSLKQCPIMGHPFQHASFQIYRQTPYDIFSQK